MVVSKLMSFGTGRYRHALLCQWVCLYGSNTVSPPEGLRAHIYSKRRIISVLIKSNLIKCEALQRRVIHRMKAFNTKFDDPITFGNKAPSEQSHLLPLARAL